MDLRQLEANAAATPPEAPAVPSVGFPTDGDPQTATPAGIPGPYWFHQIAEELRYLITQAGLTPDHETLTQLYSALQLLGLQDASETVKGKIELATNAEVQVGTDTVRAVTPAGLSARTATTSRTGIAEIATDNEVQAGTDTDRIVTPAGLASFGQSMSGSGYQKFPGGLIIQWFQVNFTTVSDTTDYSFSYPIAFPNNVFRLAAVSGDGNQKALYGVTNIRLDTLSQCTGRAIKFNASGSVITTTGMPFHIIAIGN